MKIFTHKYVIYDRGWVLEWVKKPELTPAKMVYNVTLIMWFVCGFAAMVMV